MKKLSQLLDNMKIISKKNFKDVNINSLFHSSKDCERNSLYFCITGTKVDGHNYADEAIKNGAVALIVEKYLPVDVPQILVQNTRIAMSQIANNFYDKSAEKLKIILIVGTNGKTTTSMILAKILRTCGKSVGVVGTNGVYFDEELSLPCDLTTPDPIEMHYIFSQLVAFKIEYVIIEASAHAIFLNKLYGIKSLIGIFTNITNEHLDFFGTMENYASVKMNFFNEDSMENAIINIDDKYGKELADKIKIPYLTYGIFNPSNTFAVDIKTSMKGTSFIVNSDDTLLKINTKLVGDFNVYNILAGITAGLMLGCKVECIEKALKKLERVDGRFNVYELPNNIKIIIDFAHTPDGFEKTLSLVKLLRKGRIITLFGCVEYSDSNKRKLMGEVADKYSDYLVLTADNPNKTSVQEISKDIVAGIKKCKYEIIEDRKVAISKAFGELIKNDTLVLLGKGAEKHQKINGILMDYSDIDVVKNLLKK